MGEKVTGENLTKTMRCVWKGRLVTWGLTRWVKLLRRVPWVDYIMSLAVLNGLGPELLSDFWGAMGQYTWVVHMHAP